MGAWDYTLHIADAAGEGTGNMYGWNGLIASVVAPDDPGRMTYYALPCATLTLACAAYVFRGAFDPARDTFALKWLALTLATLSWDAHLYLQDLVILAPAAAAAVGSATEWRRTLSGVGVLSGWVILGLGSVPSAIWGFNVFAAYMIVSLAAIVLWNGVAALTARSDTPASTRSLDTTARAA
jgi:hypothetical protein